MQHSKYDIWIGLFIIVGVLAIALLAMKAANLLSINTEKTYEITAIFDDIGGLKSGAAVRSAGILVGRVNELDLNDNYQATVKIKLKDSRKFPSDSSFKIMTSGILGEQYITILPGYEENDLVAGAQTTNTQSAIVLENLISQFMYQKANEGGEK